MTLAAHLQEENEKAALFEKDAIEELKSQLDELHRLLYEAAGILHKNRLLEKASSPLIRWFNLAAEEREQALQRMRQEQENTELEVTVLK